jgi:peptide/nickel transport system substrate-binding protein
VPSTRAQSGNRGTLRIALGNSAVKSLDATKTGNLVQLGIGETLMRLNTSMQLEPYLAKSVAQVSPTDWQVELRPGSTFWDGSPVTPEDVEKSFRRVWAATKADDLLLPQATKFERTGSTTFLMRLPAPQADFLYILASEEFEIHRMINDTEGVLTGAYRPVGFTPGSDRLILEAFDKHWGGPPPNARIEIRQVLDANARILALQAGDVDMAWGAPPSLLETLPDNFAKVSGPTPRIHFLNLNHRRPIFSDKAVRVATSMAINRQQVLDVALSGVGAPLYGLLPKATGLDVLERPQAQVENVEKAAAILDEAGWTLGKDGIRVKDGQRLSFVIHTWPNRAELNTIGVAVSGQLSALGYETKIQEVRDVQGLMKGNDWDMATFSNNTMSAGPQRLFLNTLFEGGADWFSGWVNKSFEDTVKRARLEQDAQKSNELLKSAEAVVLDDAVNIYLLASPWCVAYNKDTVSHFEFHPSDVFFINASTPVAA